MNKISMIYEEDIKHHLYVCFLLEKPMVSPKRLIMFCQDLLIPFSLDRFKKPHSIGSHNLFSDFTPCEYTCFGRRGPRIHLPNMRRILSMRYRTPVLEKPGRRN